MNNGEENPLVVTYRIPDSARIDISKTLKDGKVMITIHTNQSIHICLTLSDILADDMANKIDMILSSAIS